jgi:glycosyltransferase involved in cell wall biosynthesis
MKIVAAVRCYNEEKNILRFLRGYDFCDHIVVSDGGSTDDSVSILKGQSKVILHHYDVKETVGGQTWNPDAGHMNFVMDKAKELDSDWIIFDDMDDVPNISLRQSARNILQNSVQPQVNAFRLYLWGDAEYFPKMNDYFNPNYKSLWAWRPKEVSIQEYPDVKHGTLIGLIPNYLGLNIPYVLLHKSWHPDTINDKVARYNALGLPMEHPSTFAGEAMSLPEWAVE